MPDVTAVIPTHSRWHFLQQALGSVLAQEGLDVEVVVVDDGSQDETATALPATDDPRVRILRNATPVGVAAARNMGLEVARGTWVATLDDDDLWMPEKLSAQVAALRATGRSWGYGAAVKFSDGPALWHRMDAPSAERVVQRLPWKNIIPAGSSNIIVRRDALADTGLFDPSLQHMADWDMWLRLLRLGPPAVTDRHVVAYRQHGRSMQLQPVGIIDEMRVIDERYRDLRGGEQLDPGPTHRWIAMSHLRTGQRKEALRAYLAAYRESTARSNRYLLGAARSLVPVRPFPGTLRDRLRGRTSHAWPEGVEAWLRTVTSRKEEHRT